MQVKEGVEIVRAAVRMALMPHTWCPEELIDEITQYVSPPPLPLLSLHHVEASPHLVFAETKEDKAKALRLVHMMLKIQTMRKDQYLTRVFTDRPEQYENVIDKEHVIRTDWEGWRSVFWHFRDKIREEGKVRGKSLLVVDPYTRDMSRWGKIYREMLDLTSEANLAIIFICSDFMDTDRTLWNSAGLVFTRQKKDMRLRGGKKQYSNFLREYDNGFLVTPCPEKIPTRNPRKRDVYWVELMKN